ncbi:MAG: hypothetical protein JHC26_01460 [Thermofilum sp.]|jgi:hypothetical protein|uniref:hypothetical protein n=1 Tax=Thermofilum sp. TaxID=1961369 RepID=UPI0025899385|nr:hypothetical protein [Thermofilum sp.]MCI4407728.1 hypothetical protein [Thermofilum sp.]
MLQLKISKIKYSEGKDTEATFYHIEDLNGFFYTDARKLFIDDTSIENYGLNDNDALVVTVLSIEAKNLRDDKDKGTVIADEVSIKTIYTVFNALIEELSDLKHH